MVRNAIIIICVLFLAGCATTTRKGKNLPSGLSSLKEVCENSGVTYSLDPVSQTVFLSRAGSSANALLGSDVVLIGTEKVMLSAPLKFDHGIIIIPSDFKEKVIDRLAEGAAVPRKDYSLVKIRTIVLDAGHGGKDPGAIGGSGAQEKSVVLDITRKLKALLEKKRFRIIMTRDQDEFIPLKERTEIASATKADLFISIHANAHAKKNIHGVEVYSLKDLDAYELKELQRQENQETYCKQLSMKHNDDDLKRIVSDILYSYKQEESSRLAEETAQKTSELLSTKNLGLKTSHFFVLRNTLIPAILVEVGYLTNPKEEKLLKLESYRQKIAYALAKSIVDYANE